MTHRSRLAILALILAVFVIAPSVSAAGLVVKCDTEQGYRCEDQDGAIDLAKICTTDTAKTVCGNAGACVQTITNPCGVDSFVTQFIVLSQYAIGIVITLGAGMLVYGGFEFITAAGRPSKIDEGKRVILGTIIGLMISFTAFVIVNLTVAAITGSPLAPGSLNPFGAIARVFPSDKKISRAFNTTGQPSDNGKCYSLSSGWDKSCEVPQIHCADTDAKAGSIHTYQKVLNDKGCYATGTNSAVDGCFGPATLAAVRRFQLAADLVPTGQIDSQTKNLLDNPTVSTDCASKAAAIDSVNQLLPSASDNTEARDVTGCCILSKGAINLYCANQVSRRTCLAQGGDFKEGATSCATDPASRSVCGYCGDPSPGIQRCFQTVSNFWCTEVVRDTTDPAFRMTFVLGQDCHGAPACSNECSNKLLNMPP